MLQVSAAAALVSQYKRKQRMSEKIKLLVWSDSVLAPTGFGTVSRYVLEQLHTTGRFEIDQLAINYYGEFYDRKKYPYQISPARILNPSDPFGNEMLIRSLSSKDYDILWVLNDIFVVNGVVKELDKLKLKKRQEGKKVFKTIYYYPIDCTVIEQAASMINFADAAVCITDYGRQETIKKMPKLNKPIDVIYHGCDPVVFSKTDGNLRRMWRERYLGVSDPETFIWINVNRNSVRKDMGRTILAFSEFKKVVPNSVLYMHCMHRDNKIDLIQASRDLNLSNKKDVLFPARFNLHEGGFPIEALVNFYSAADAFISTTLGEGWGLTTTEAMSIGLPCLLPRNTSAPEILGENEERGYLYECTEEVWIDNSGYRPWGKMEDILPKMLQVYEEKRSPAQTEMLEKATSWVYDHTWEQVSRGWIDIFDRVIEQKATQSSTHIAEEL